LDARRGLRLAGLASNVPDLARFVSMHLGATASQASEPVRGASPLEMRHPVATFDPDNPRSRGSPRGIRRAFVARDVLPVLLEMAAHLALDETIDQQPHDGQHGQGRNPLGFL
jgi:hypothetical protein